MIEPTVYMSLFICLYHPYLKKKSPIVPMNVCIGTRASNLLGRPLNAHQSLSDIFSRRLLENFVQ